MSQMKKNLYGKSNLLNQVSKDQSLFTELFSDPQKDSLLFLLSILLVNGLSGYLLDKLLLCPFLKSSQSTVKRLHYTFISKDSTLNSIEQTILWLRRLEPPNKNSGITFLLLETRNRVQVQSISEAEKGNSLETREQMSAQSSSDLSCQANPNNTITFTARHGTLLNSHLSKKMNNKLNKNPRNKKKNRRLNDYFIHY